MSEPAKRDATYEDLYSIPENMTGEIINGEIIATPRPSREHSMIASNLGAETIPPYTFGRGGPGGWIIIIEPEIGLGKNIIVPDLAGWKVERYPFEEPHNWISVVPDWICEIFSPSTQKRDRMEKTPIYAQFGVSFLWLVNPTETTLDVYELGQRRWELVNLYTGNIKVRAVPFEEIEIDLTNIWYQARLKQCP